MSNVRFCGFNINKALIEIVNESNLDGNEKFILITISFYHEELIENNPSMSLSLDKIAWLLKCSRTTANRIVKGLIEKGYLESIKKGQGKPNIYVFKGWRKWQ